jgi:hypothetical protein
MWLWAVHKTIARKMETMGRMWSESRDKRAWIIFPVDEFFHGYIGATATGFKSMRTHT